MYVASFAFASAHKYEIADNVEGNDVILTEACGCPLHVLGPKVRAGTTHARTHTHTHSVSYSEIPSSNLPRNQITSQILFYFLFFFIPPKANSGTVPQISHDHFILNDFQTKCCTSLIMYIFRATILPI
jgi:hypothetical protein